MYGETKNIIVKNILKFMMLAIRLEKKPAWGE